MKTIGLLSGKGGVGKTSSAINIAAALHYLGNKSIVIDTNFTTPNVGLHLGYPTHPASIHNVLKGEKKIHDAIYRHPTGFHFIPGSLAVEDMESLKLGQLKTIKQLDADYLILDGAAGLGKEALATMEHADELIIVTNPELPAITDALKTIRIAQALGKTVKGILVTRKRNDTLDISLKNIEAMLEIPIIGVIPEDNNMRQALAMKDTIIYTHPQSNAAKSYVRFAAALSGQEIADDNIKLNWIDKFFKLFKRIPQ